MATLRVARHPPDGLAPSWHQTRLAAAGLGARQRRLLRSAADDAEERTFTSRSTARLVSFLRYTRGEYERAAHVEWRQMARGLIARGEAIEAGEYPRWGAKLLEATGPDPGDGLWVRAIAETLPDDACGAVVHRWRWALARRVCGRDSVALAEMCVTVSVVRGSGALAGGDSAVVASVPEPAEAEIKKERE